MFVFFILFFFFLLLFLQSEKFQQVFAYFFVNEEFLVSLHTDVILNNHVKFAIGEIINLFNK